ncbi:hypothetical protein KR222_009040, partial [Zaprionus bogoriensis]
IVVETPLQGYEQPSLQDFKECQVKREACQTACDADVECQTTCPVCPELIDEASLQDLNKQPVNTTNIIRLTNEISNTINHAIYLNNTVKAVVHQNVSQVGGRFGLGFTEAGPCCHVVRYARDCEHKEKDCKEQSRQRVCGERCISRVMIARIVVQCESDDSENCHEKLEYVPARKRKATKTQTPTSACRYPYTGWSCMPSYNVPSSVGAFSCPSKCLELTLGVILQNGMPPACASCYPSYPAPILAYPVPMWYAAPYYQPYLPSFPLNQVPQQPEEDWNLVSEKWKDNEGATIIDTDGSGDHDDGTKVVAPERLPPAHLEGDDNVAAPERLPPAHLESDDLVAEPEKPSRPLDSSDVPSQRRRRHQ